ncbi:MAG: prepilin-type N-terminal cleavage/methylation domain-containing protein [Lachnospiraceae bacterium]|nr:prepilin-type N-terminal cleavage/methylation domain-containing protein [Lachnospiraceae bacterium]
MEALAKKVRRRMSLKAYGAGDKGLSLVEVICAVAIFAVIAATIGGVLVFSARSYHKGSTESEVQQEAQFAANRISGIIQNATEVEYNTNKLTMKQGNVVHEVSLVNTDLKYKEIEKDDSGAIISESSLQTLAGNIKDFNADVSEFEKARTVILDMTVAKNDKEYPVRYTMNARNEEITVSTSALPPSASIQVDDNNLILVPGESYTVGVNVRGTDRPFDATGGAGISVSKTASSITVTVDRDNRNSNAMITLFVKDVDGTELCSKMVNVDIRSVNNVRLQKNQTTGTREYTFYADVDCLNSDKVVGGSNETNYKNPFTVEWSGKLFTCSSTPGNFDTEIGSFTILDEDDGTGKNKLSCSNADVAKYICIDDNYPAYASRAEETTLKRPYLKIKLTDEFDSNTKLVVRATAKHPMGVNKASSVYGAASCFDEKEITVPKLKATKILMIPGQTYTLSGLRVVNPECSVFIGQTEVANPADAGVIPVFEANNKLKITLTDKAKGDSNGIITLKVHSQGSTATQLPVDIYVRRVNPASKQSGIRSGTLKLDYQLMEGTNGDGTKKSPNGEWGVSAEYQFKTRIQGTNLNVFHANAGFLNIKNDEKYDNTNNFNPYAVKFSWVLKINGKEVSTTKGSAVVSMYADGKEITSADAVAETAEGLENDYFRVTSFGLNKESPALNMITKKEFGSGWELVVTARALHPREDEAKARNKYNYIYYTGEPDSTGVIKEPYIEGSYTLKRKTMIVVADPTQGVALASTKKENNTDHRYELCIPVEIGAGIGSLNGHIVGNQKDGTKFLAELTEMPPSEGTAYVFLAIDRDERGGKEGTYKAVNGSEVACKCVEGELKLILDEVEASAPNAVKSQTEITIYLRRVEEVQIAGAVEPEEGHPDLEINFLDKIKRGRDFAFYDNENGMTDDKGDREQAAVREAAQKFGFSDGMRHWVYRTQEITETDNGAVKYGEWTPYIKTKDSDANNKRLMEAETNSLRADKRYKMEMSLFVFDEGSRTFYWPHDESILQEGTFKGWNKGGSGWDQKTPGFDPKTLKSSYGTIYNIGQACMVFKESNGTPVKSIGSLENPKVMKPGDTYQVALDGYGIYFPHNKQFCQVRVQKRSGAGWTKPTSPGNEGWNVGGSKDTFQLNGIPESANGLYRFCYDMVNSDLNHWNGNPLQPDYGRTNSDTFPLYGSKGTAGYIYIRVDGTAGDTGNTGSTDTSFDYVNLGNPDNSAYQLTLNGGVTKGCGSDWEKYFKQQTDVDPNDSSKTIPVRWDRVGNGANAFVGYKNPYALKWELSHDGGKTWIPLEPQNDAFKNSAFVKEYIDALKIASPSDRDVENLNTEGTLTLGLKKKLPKGTQIKMVSVHSAGNNRGGREYYRADKPEIVYDIYTVSGGRTDLVECGFERYNEHNYILPGFESIPNYMSEYTHWSGQQTFYRYRPVGGTWSQYYRMDSGEPNRAYITGGRTGSIFRSDTDYELDCVFVVYNADEKKIYWPLNDETLLQPGMGFAEAGYSLAQWDYENHLTKEQRNFQCRQEYYIAKTELFIEPYPNPDRNQTEIRQTISGRSRSAGTEKNPIKVDSWSQTNSKQWFSVNMDPYAFCLHAQQGIFGVIIDKKTDNGWERVDEASMQEVQKWTVTARNPEITVGYAYGAKGLYRLRAYIDGIKWTQPTGNMFDPTYQQTSEEQMRLYDDNGNGTIFVEFEIQTPPPSWGQ